MPAASYSSSPDPRSLSPRRRALVMALTIAAHLIVALLLLWFGGSPLPPPPPPAPKPFSLLPDRGASPARAVAVAKAHRSSSKPSHPLPTPPPPPLPVPHPLPAAPLDMIHIDLAHADIAKIPAAHDDQSSDESANTGDDSGSSSGPGEGPGGERLYDPQWAREPSNAELDPYLPKSAPRSGWGMVACRTVPGNRVEDCRQIGESPLGSGFARAVRQAAWQFRVLPPRIGGKLLVGAWVRIRIEYHEGVVKDY